MADNKNVETDEHGTKFYKDDEDRKVYFRNCFKETKEHDPHTWRSYYFGDTSLTYDNAVCDGTGKQPEYAKNYSYSTWKSSVSKKKDYSEDAENFPVSDPITVTQARKIAYDMHKDQKDKAGEPYVLHLNAVEKGVVILGGDAEERIAALFHDAVEDYHTTYALLKKINVTDRTLIMIEALSKRSNEEQTVYLDRIKNAGTNLPKVLTDLGVQEDPTAAQGAARGKIADLLHNTRHDRIQALRDENKGYVADRLLKKYRPALAALMIHLNMIVTETDQQEFIATSPKGSATGGYGYTSSYGYKGTPTQKSSTPKASTATNPPKALQSVTVEPDDALSEWDADSILVGDWIDELSAPVIDTDHDLAGKTIDVTLANGEVVTYDENEKVAVYGFNKWSTTIAEARSVVEGWADDVLDVGIWATMLAKADSSLTLKGL